MRTVLSATFVFCLAGPALASECPALWQQINAKMQTAHLSEADKAKLMEFRKNGEDLHHAGSHAESVAALKEALALLG